MTTWPDKSPTKYDKLELYIDMSHPILGSFTKVAGFKENVVEHIDCWAKIIDGYLLISTTNPITLNSLIVNVYPLSVIRIINIYEDKLKLTEHKAADTNSNYQRKPSIYD